MYSDVCKGLEGPAASRFWSVIALCSRRSEWSGRITGVVASSFANVRIQISKRGLGSV
jgi:hypothetical protein